MMPTIKQGTEKTTSKMERRVMARIEEVVDLKTCVLDTYVGFFFCFALFVSFVLTFLTFFFPSLFPGHPRAEGEGLLFSLVSSRLLWFLV